MSFQTKTGDIIEDPISNLERRKVASQCVDDLNLPMPALIDKIDDAVNQAYNGWPDRLFLIGKNGKIAYSGGRGPFFFSTDEWAEAIKTELGTAGPRRK